jgi:hypothetical protein
MALFHKGNVFPAEKGKTKVSDNILKRTGQRRNRIGTPGKIEKTRGSGHPSHSPDGPSRKVTVFS